MIGILLQITQNIFNGQMNNNKNKTFVSQYTMYSNKVSLGSSAQLRDLTYVRRLPVFQHTGPLPAYNIDRALVLQWIPVSYKFKLF